MGWVRHEERIAACAWVLAACVLAWVVSRGFVGPARRLDARAVLLGGICWSQGISPYVADAYANAWQLVFHGPRPDEFVFAYPPTSALLLVPLGWLGADAGLSAIDGLNLASLGLVLAGCIMLVRNYGDGPWRRARLGVGLALAAAVGPISGTLLLGQTGLWALTGMVGLWVLPRGRFPAARVMCVIVATTKPTVALPVLCFVAVTEPALMAVAVLASLAVCAPVLLTSGGLAVPGQWLEALRTYASTPANTPLELASAQHLLFRFVPAVPPAVLTVLGALVGVLVGLRARKYRSPEHALEHWLLLVAVSAACLPLHTYDLILIVPLAVAIPFAKGSSRFWFPIGVLLAARPSALAGLLARFGMPFEHAAPAVAAVGTAVIAAGACFHAFTGRSVLSDRPVLPTVEVLPTVA